VSLTREEVLRIAGLAELDVTEETLEALVDQVSMILDYVSQLQEVPTGEASRPFLAGPDALRLRPDEVRPWPLAFGPGQMAPAFENGFFVVPRLGQFEDEDGRGEGGGRGEDGEGRA
jgi:aspartyl-tRNA(Asn)/glutamyl-tRNA(Gln) amidotransferase subunit C